MFLIDEEIVNYVLSDDEEDKKQKIKKLRDTVIGLCITNKDKIIRIALKKKLDEFMESHFTIGMGIRNEWIRSGNPELVKFFLDQDVKHPDDMSAMILTSYYRYLTNSND